jgi:hypothetical protein
MTSTCRIFTRGGPVTDPTTGEVTYAELNPVVTKCRVRPRGSRSSTGAEAGGAELIVTGYIVSVPATCRPLHRRTFSASSSSPPRCEPDRPALEIRDVARGDNISARRLICQEAA